MRVVYLRRAHAHIMKKSVFLLIPLLLLFASCEKETKNYDLAIHLQTQFDHDNVLVYVDGHPEFDRQVTTNDALGFAGGTTTVRNPGNHQVKVVINNTITKTAIFPLNANLFLGINYNKLTKKISLTYSNQPFVYD